MGRILDMLTARGWSEKAALWIARIGLFLAVILILAAVLAISRCTSNGQKAAQNRVSEGQSGAFANSATDAVGTQAGVNANATASEDLTRSNSADIHAAPGANDRVNPGVDAAGRKALCQRKAYKDTPQCKKP